MPKECPKAPDGKHDYEPDVVIINNHGKEERVFFMVCRWCSKIKGGKGKKKK